MKGFLINPFTREVTEIEYHGNYKEIYQFIGAHLFTVVDLGHGETLYVDDEGLFKPLQKQAYFGIRGYHNPLAGNGLILGTDVEGETIESAFTLARVKSLVLWIDREKIRELSEGGAFNTVITPMSKDWTPIVEGKREVIQFRVSEEEEDPKAE